MPRFELRPLWERSLGPGQAVLWELCMRLQEVTLREVELSPSRVLRVFEHTELADCAGAVVWDAALVLVHYLAKGEHSLLRGKRVLDLGAGTGVAGLAAALLGAPTVLLTDLPRLLPGLERNVEANGLEARVSTRELAWGACTAGLRTPYDLVLASDLIYEQAQLPALADTLAALIAPAACGGGSAPRADSRAGAPPPSGRVLLAYEQRPLVVERAFAEFARAGLSAERVPPEDLHPEWQSADIFVYWLRLSQ